MKPFIQKPEVRNIRPEVRNLQPEVRNLQPEVRNIQPEIAQLDPEVRSLRLKNQKPQVKMFFSKSAKKIVSCFSWFYIYKFFTLSTPF